MEDISFRENMSQAIVQFCRLSEQHLELCNITRCVPHNRMKDVTCSIIYFSKIWKSKYVLDKGVNSNIMCRPYNSAD